MTRLRRLLFNLQSWVTPDATPLIPGWKSLRTGLSAKKVRGRLGNPLKENVSTVPAGDAFTTQSIFKIKIRAGDSMMDWYYVCGDKAYWLFFARVDEEWCLSAWVKYPSIIDGGLAIPQNDLSQKTKSSN
jgi:hypothetical protein